MALGTICFLLPNQLSCGGFSGIATIIYYYFGVKLGIIIIVLNLPLFIIAFKKLGKKFVIKSIFATIIYSFILDILDGIVIFKVEDLFLASVYGGIFIGIGIAIVLKTTSSTGGSDLIAYIFQSYNSYIGVGKYITSFDFVVIILNLIAFKKIEIGLYSIITIMIIDKMIDIIFEGINFCKVIYIISNKYEKISNDLIYKLGRGVTTIDGIGAYSNESRKILMCVIKRIDVEKAKKLIKEIDNHAFIIIVDSREVLGNGFKIN